MQNILLSIVFFASLFACEGQSKKLVSLSGLTMGTTYSIKIVHNEDVIDKTVLHTRIEDILIGINQSMSTYIKDSELSLFNQLKNCDWLALSDDLYHVIEHADRVSQLSRGAFDITVGPLVNLWGFGADSINQQIPSDFDIHTIKEHTGYQKLNLNQAAKQVSKSDPDLTLDLSGIAKGFAVDKIAHYLDKLGIEHYLIEIGGELIAKGNNIAQQTWQIGIEQAKPLERSVQRIVSLNNIAMATSGDYRNYFEKDNIRYSHTIDPVTGISINHKLAAVTVLHPSSMHADALATAFMVLGPEKSMILANENDIAIYMLIKTSSGFEERYNDLFKSYSSD